MIVGLCGKAGSGKDTIGDYLIGKYGFEKESFAKPLKKAVQEIFVIDDFTMNDRVAREQKLAAWPEWSVRELLQFVGTELCRKQLYSDIWVRSFVERTKLKKDTNFVITDIRFPNELEYLKTVPGFRSIKVVRPGYEGNVGKTAHESESYDLQTEATIYNRGTIEDLYHTVDCMKMFENVVTASKTSTTISS